MGAATAGRGIVVATDRYVAFVPTERPKNLASEVAWAGAGFVTIRIGGTIPPKWVIQQLGLGPLDRQTQLLCSELSGQLWRPHEAFAYERTIPLRRKHRGLWFRNGKQSIRLARAISITEFDQVRAHLRSWTWQR
ncbi:hypothetical protein GCM10009765_44230 [Fodinicola feengrottensis]|uniref:Uncharacterized protein n=2 Tax=Fodinicola feengrottensis TaxID=435914 RepID=A0ABN2HLS7_9ACTN